MTLHRRDFLHGVLSVPVGTSLLADFSMPRISASAENGAELQAALRAAQPGSVINLAPGNYGDVSLLDLTVPDVTIRSSVPHAAILRAPMEVTGERAKLLDLAFWGEGEDNIYMVAKASCSNSLVVSASNVEVAGCDFGFFPARAMLVRYTGVGVYIHNCKFHDNRNGGGNSNAHEAIALGYDNPNSSKALKARVIANEMWNLNVEVEAISVKSSQNLIEGNKISSSKAGFTNRCGEGNTFRNNSTTNARGFYVLDKGNSLLNNTVNGGGKIMILGGNSPASNNSNAAFCQATDTYLAGNSGSMTIGAVWQGNLPALRTKVASHKGSIQLKNHSGTILPKG